MKNCIGDLRRFAQRLILGRALLEKIQENDLIITQAARVTVGMEGDYLEFGVWGGHSFAEAYLAVGKASQWAYRLWRTPATRCRFFAFDSFEGLPEIKGIDQAGPFGKGDYSCSQQKFLQYIASRSVNLKDVTCVKGWYNETLTAETRQRLGLLKARIIHIDCDLYESARDALSFCTAIIQEGSVVIFDDWFQFRGNPDRGEQRAFREWLEANPQLQAVQFTTEPPFRNSFIISHRLS
jgi:O-methyltransferase